MNQRIDGANPGIAPAPQSDVNLYPAPAPEHEKLFERLSEVWHDAGARYSDAENIRLSINQPEAEEALTMLSYSGALMQGMMNPEARSKVSLAFNDLFRALTDGTGRQAHMNRASSETLRPIDTLRAATMLMGICRNLREDGKTSADFVRGISHGLHVKPPTLGAPFTRNRRATDLARETYESVAVERGDKAIKMAHGAAIVTVALIDSVMKLGNAGEILTDIQLEGHDNRFLNQSLLKQLRQRKLEERAMVTGFFETGYIDYVKADRHLTQTLDLLDKILEKELPAEVREHFEELSQDNGVDLYAELHQAYRTIHTPYDQMTKVFIATALDLREMRKEAKYPQNPAEESRPQYKELEQPISPDSEELKRQEQLQQELIAEHARLMMQLAELRGPYNPSMKTLRASGLNTLLYSLQNGEHNEITGVHLDGISKPNAQGILQTLHGLGAQRSTVEDAATFRRNTMHELGLEGELVKAIRSLRAQLLVLNINGFDTLNSELNSRLQWLSENKTAMQAVIQGTMATDEAARYNSMLEELFSQADRYEATQDESVLEEVVPEPVEHEVEAEALPELDVEEMLPAMPLRETDVARQLDWEVFPPGVTLLEIQERVAGVYKDSDAAAIDWGRIHDLLQIANSYEGTVYRSKPRSLGATEPYFVVEATINGKDFVIAENPQYGNATYILRTDRAYEGASWREIFEQSREFARILGAERVVHSDRMAHLDRILSNLQSQLLVKVD